MKKFMFTAIAMVAFTGSSMANTIEKNTTENNSIELNTSEAENQIFKRLSKCEVVAMALVELFEQESGVCDDNGHLYNFIKSNCENS